MKNNSYFQLLKTNRDFRKFWIAQQISMAGDWITSIPLLGLVLTLTGSGLDTSLVLVFTLIPYVLFAPFSGVLADRTNRKAIMVIGDFIRTPLVLGFLLIHHASQIWIVYVLIIIGELIGVLYYPAASSAFPNLVESHELYTANALSGASWGVMLAVGSALGGIIASLWGRNICFIVDSASFFISASITLTIKRPFSKQRIEKKETGGFRDLKEGLQYSLSQPRIWQVILLNGGLGFATGMVILYSIFPVQVFHDGDFGIGTLYAIRGVGNIIGAPLARHLVPEEMSSLRKGLFWSGIVVGVFYLFFSQSPGLLIACAAVLLDHIGNGAFWTLCNFSIQKLVPDQYLGRVLSFQTAVFTLAMAGASLLCGALVGIISPRWVAAGFGVVTLIYVSFWFKLTRRSFQ
ncbi:MAG: MFS transporter [Firmicutes bacterium]|nr:MFS transporter [Bacillota bacterium]